MELGTHRFFPCVNLLRIVSSRISKYESWKATWKLQGWSQLFANFGQMFSQLDSPLGYLRITCNGWWTEFEIQKRLTADVHATFRILISSDTYPDHLRYYLVYNLQYHPHSSLLTLAIAITGAFWSFIKLLLCRSKTHSFERGKEARMDMEELEEMMQKLCVGLDLWMFHGPLVMAFWPGFGVQRFFQWVFDLFLRSFYWFR